MKDTPLAQALFSDALAYDAWAQRIAAGNWWGDGVFYQAPLYPYFLATIYSIFGRDLLIVRGIQIALGAASCVLLALAGRAFFSRRVGIAAGLLLALFPTAVFYDGLIQKASLALFFMTALLAALGRCRDGPRAVWCVVSGALLGCFALVFENALVLGPVVLIWLALGFGEAPARRRFACVALFAAGGLLILLPVAVRNKRVGDELVLTTAQFGPNFYIGNNRNATGLYAALLPGRGDAAFERRDAVKLAEAELGRQLSPKEVSRYWTRKALADIRSDPRRWGRLLITKWLLVWNRVEIADAEDMDTYQDASALLRGLNTVLHLGVICPMAALGVYLTWSQRRNLWLLYLVVLAIALSVTMFFVFGRYRFPMTPVLILFAAAALMQIAPIVRRRDWRSLLFGAAIAFLSALILNWPLLPGYDPRSATYNNVGAALSADGKHAEAIEALERALALEPGFAGARNNYGSVLASQGRIDEALQQFREAVRLEPDFAGAQLNLGAALVEAGRTAEGVVHLKEATRLAPHYAMAHSQLAAALAKQGEIAEAEREYLEALRYHPRFAAAHNALGELLARQGRKEDALRAYQEAIRLAPRFALAHRNLGRLYLQLGNTPGAVDHYRQAIAFNARIPFAAPELAWILATSTEPGIRNPQEALRLALEACPEGRCRDAKLLDTLAAAYASAGRFPTAVATAEKAADAADAAADDELAARIRARLEGYRQRRAHREGSRKTGAQEPG